MWLELVVLAVVVSTVIGVAAVVFGRSRWRRGTERLRADLASYRLPVARSRFDQRELQGLPAPVQRFFRATLSDGQPIIAAVRMQQHGGFNLGRSKAVWCPFTSTQVVVTRRPGFDWDARITTPFGMRVLVHDALIAGEGILHASLLGLVTLMKAKSTPQIAEGELLRFLAEATWYPTALLPSQGVRWAPLDDHSSRATFSDGTTIARLDFEFDCDGLVKTVRTSSRWRTVDGKAIATAWQGRFWAYETRNGMQVPLEGEVAWELPEGLWPYWRGRVTHLEYEFAR
ncbi:MAG: DUF6544 family protein [Acidobacteriota bacterium]